MSMKMLFDSFFSSCFHLRVMGQLEGGHHYIITGTMEKLDTLVICLVNV